MLTCTLVVDNIKAYVIVSLPLFDIKSKYDVYQIHNLPIPMKHIQHRKITNTIARWEVEAKAIANNWVQKKFILLKEEEIQKCTNPLLTFCQLIQFTEINFVLYHSYGKINKLFAKTVKPW